MHIKLAFLILSFRHNLNSDGEVISESDQWYFYMLIIHNFHLDYDASLLGWNDNMLPVGSSYGRIYTGELAIWDSVIWNFLPVTDKSCLCQLWLNSSLADSPVIARLQERLADESAEGEFGHIIGVNTGFILKRFNYPPQTNKSC